MRSDMSRLIIEDGRRGDGGPRTCYDKVRRVGDEFENLPSFESMSRHRKQDGNSSGDRLNPLRRYLASRVGQPWSKVYAEIAAVNDRRTIRGFHLFQHLWQEVVVGSPKNLRYHYKDFIVGPDGILKRRPKEESWRTCRRKKKNAPVETILLEDGWKYEKIKGIWYHIHIRKIETHYPCGFVTRVIGEGKKWEHQYTHFVPSKTEVSFVQDAKLQCGKKELREIRERIGAGR